MKKNKAFTLIELTIALAILAIIAAILVPTFMNATDRARLRADVQSAIVIRNAMDLYRSEWGRDAGTTSAVTSPTMEQVLTGLSQAGNLEIRNTQIQTEGALWQLDAAKGVVVNITNSSTRVKTVAASLTENERYLIVGIP